MFVREWKLLFHPSGKILTYKRLPSIKDLYYNEID